MTQPAPTTLVIPDPVTPTGSGAMGLAPVLLGGGVLLGVLIVLIVRRRGGGLGPGERAFRRLVRRMGLSRQQAARVRRYAHSRSVGSPVGVLMNEALLREALGRTTA